MTMLEKLLGVSLVSAVFFWVVGAVVFQLAKYPGWVGIVLAILTSITGCYVIASVVRDRL